MKQITAIRKSDNYLIKLKYIEVPKSCAVLLITNRGQRRYDDFNAMMDDIQQLATSAGWEVTIDG